MLKMLACCALALAASAAQAQGWCGASLCPPLPDAVGTVQVTGLGGQLPMPPPGGRFDGSTSGAGIAYQPLPLLESDAHIRGQIDTTVASADLVYFFRLESVRPFVGPVSVPILFQGFWSAAGTASGGARADAEVRASVNVFGFEPLAGSFSTTGCGTPCVNGGTWTRSFSMAGGALSSVHLFMATDAQAGFQPTAAAQVTALLDPSITVDPRFAADWFVAASAGVGTAAPVPEPAPALLLAAGAALLLSRRRALRARRPPSR